MTDASTALMRFHATVDYQTPGGNPGVWSGEIEATWDTVHDVAVEAARKARRAVAKVNGGNAVPAVWVRP